MYHTSLLDLSTVMNKWNLSINQNQPPTYSIINKQNHPLHNQTSGQEKYQFWYINTKKHKHLESIAYLEACEVDQVLTETSYNSVESRKLHSVEANGFVLLEVSAQCLSKSTQITNTYNTNHLKFYIQTTQNERKLKD